MQALTQKTCVYESKQIQRFAFSINKAIQNQLNTLKTHKMKKSMNASTIQNHWQQTEQATPVLKKRSRSVDSYYL